MAQMPTRCPAGLHAIAVQPASIAGIHGPDRLRSCPGSRSRADNPRGFRTARQVGDAGQVAKKSRLCGGSDGITSSPCFRGWGDAKNLATAWSRCVGRFQYRCNECARVDALELPVRIEPVFYMAESKDGTREVIDGQQRLTTLFRFLDNELSLVGLKARPDL